MENHKGIELEEDMPHHKKSWKLKRLGWLLMCVFLIAVLLGLTGDGMLSEREITVQDAKIKYERFLRFHKMGILEFESTATTSDSLIIQINKTYMDGYEIKSILPFPDSQVTRGENIQFVFKAAKNEENKSKVTFQLNPIKRGLIKAHIRIQQQKNIIFTQFIYP